VIVQETLEDGWYDAIVVERSGDMLAVRWREYPRDRKFSRHRLSVALMAPNGLATPTLTAAAAAAGTQQPSKTRSVKEPASQSSTIAQPFPTTWEEIDVNHLVLAKQDGPWAGWWEAIAIENHGSQLTLRWRDYPKLPTIVRPRFSLGLLYPKAS
jgi:hypothetical protein